MNKLKFISDELGVLAVPYEFGEWTNDVKYPYFVGEINETATMTEDGYEESTMLLTGFTRGKYIDLEIIKEKIKSIEPEIKSAILERISENLKPKPIVMESINSERR